MITKAQLSSIHPIFRVPSVQTTLIEEVQKQSKTIGFHDRTIVISTPGIFIIKRRTFPGVPHVCHAISWFDLEAITCKDISVTIRASNYWLNFQTTECESLVKAICSARTSILSCIPLQISVPPSFGAIPEYKTKSLLADRFLAAVLKVNLAIDVPQITEIYEILTVFLSSVTFGPTFSTSAFIDPISKAVAFDPKVTGIVLENLSLSSFLPYFSSILQANTQISCLSFRSITFSKSHSTFDCSDSEAFFDSLSHLKRHFTELEFFSCEFDPNSLDLIFFSECFHELEAIAFNGINLPNEILIFFSQLLSCDWVLQKKCLKSVSIVKCGIDVGEALSCFLSLETGVASYDLRSNVFLKKLACGPRRPAFSSLCLCGCEVSVDAMVSLFSFFRTLRADIDVDLSEIHMNDSTFPDLYSALSAIGDCCVSSITFDSNLITPQFFDFLSNQKNLSEVSLSFCFDGSADQTDRLLKFVDDRRLTKLCLAAGAGSAMGGRAAELLRLVLKSNSIVELDLTGQCIGDEGISILKQIVDMNTVRTLKFDVSKPSSSKILIDFCQVLLKSQVTSASFPEKDFLRISDVNISELQRQFMEKFGQECLISQSIRGIPPIRPPTPTKRTAVLAQPSPGRQRRLSTGHIIHHLGGFVVQNPDLLKLIGECGQSFEEDPIEQLWLKINSEYTISSLLKSEG